jgi:RHS repeat-associated protein
MKAVDVDGNSVTDYMYHNENWQVVEVRRGVNQTPTAAAYKQFAYDIRYIDSPVCRWWDADSDGTMEPAAGEMQYFTNDGNFNTTALIDANSGQVVERYLYDPYGKVTVLNGASGAEKDPNVTEWSPDADNKSDWDNEILFCGYWYDPETGLFHVRERYYDPITGTWKTRDRILYPDGMNLYAYCRGNPISQQDPWGLKAPAVNSNFERREYIYESKGITSRRDLISQINRDFGTTLNRTRGICIQPMPNMARDDATRAKMKERWSRGELADCGVYNVRHLVDSYAAHQDQVRVDVANDPKTTWQMRWKDGKDHKRIDPATGGTINEPGPGGFQATAVGHGGAVEMLGFFLFGADAQFVPVYLAEAAAQYLKDQASNGLRPLRDVVVIGHGARTSKTLGPRDGRQDFGVDNLLNVAKNKNDSYDDAVSGELPLSCWFTQGSQVRLAGCSTGETAAKDWADRALPYGATARGTDSTVWVSYYDAKDGSIGGYAARFQGDSWDYTPTQFYNDTYHNTRLGMQMSHWIEHTGRN